MLSLIRFPIFLLVSTFGGVVLTSSDGKEEGASFRSLTQDERKVAKEAGYSYVDRLTQLEEDLYAKGFHVKDGSPMSMMAKFKRPSQDVIDISRTNMRFVETVRYLKNHLGLKEEEIARTIEDREFDSGCLSDPVCPNSQKYRTIDGSCNNRDTKLKNLGRAVSGYRRLLKPAYDDGVSSPRRLGTNGIELPSPRLVSMNVFSNGDRPLSNITSLLMQFGQFINHDMESTSQFTFPNGEGFPCCSQNNTPLDPSVLSSLVHCLPITIPEGDVQLNNSDKRCMNFVRSSTGPNRISCELPFVSYAEQFNQNTHWLDASTVYGSNINKTTLLRNASNGMLNTFIDGYYGHSVLPLDTTNFFNTLFSAGDSRVNEQPQLTVIHTIWMREHNRIANILGNLNPAWSSETVFQEARRIVIAELQHITYNEFLPTLLGFSGMQKNRLLWPLPGKQTFQNKKSTATKGPITNEFATAAFRMGHSLVQGNVELVGINGQVTSYSMRNQFNMAAQIPSPFFFVQQFFYDDTIRGLVTQHSQKIDNQITDDLRLHLFRNTQSDYGGQTNAAHNSSLDIVALNIQRGRDHGLPSYNKYRQICGLPKLTGPISSLPTTKPKDKSSPYFDPKAVNALKSIYNNVDDIDLYVGGLLEINQQEDGLLGPTFMCIIAENFLTLKLEDRYFYEAGKGTNPYPFTSEQLIEIKKSSMARIFCDNNDGTVSSIQPNAFLVPSSKNHVANCKSGSIPSLNFDLWKVSGPNQP